MRVQADVRFGGCGGAAVQGCCLCLLRQVCGSCGAHQGCRSSSWQQGGQWEGQAKGVLKGFAAFLRNRWTWQKPATSAPPTLRCHISKTDCQILFIFYTPTNLGTGFPVVPISPQDCSKP